MNSDYLEIPRIYTVTQEALPVPESFNQGIFFFKSANFKEAHNIFYKIANSENQFEDRACLLNNLGCSKFVLGKYFEARDLFIEALSILNQKDAYEKISVMLNLGYTNLRVADFSAASNNFGEMKELLLSLKTFSRMYLAFIANGLTAIAKERGDLDKAFELLEEALVIAKEKDIESDLTVIYFHEMSSTLKRIKGNFQESLSISRNNLLIINTNKIDHPTVGMLHNSIALSLRSMASYYQAIKEVDIGLEILGRFYDEIHPDIALLKNTKGLLNHNIDYYHEGMSLIVDAMKVYKFANLQNHPDMAKFYNNLGLTYKGLSKYEEAIKNYQEAINILTTNFGPNHSGIAPQYNNIGVAHKKLGQYRESMACYMKCYHILQKSYTIKHPLVADILLNIGYLMHLMDIRKEVHPCFKRSAIIYNVFYGKNHFFSGKAKLKNNSTDTDVALNSLNDTFA